MNTQIFELAPRSRRHEWDKALAFSLAPTAPTAMALYFMADGNLLLTAIVTAVCFLGMVAVALSVVSTPVGRLTISRGVLTLESGFAQICIPLSELDVTSARAGEASEPGTRLVTDPKQVVYIPARVGPGLLISPSEPDRFLAALREAAGVK